MKSEYTKSSMSKLQETLRLINNSIRGAQQQASLLFKTYVDMDKQFNLKNKTILEIGANSRGGLVSLIDSSNKIFGIDKYLGTIQEGLWKYLKTSVRMIFFDPLFRFHLKKLNNGGLQNNKVIAMDATKLEFDNNYFDFIFSRCVLEHIDDINKLAQETFRCLKPGGRTYHIIDLYTSLGGAHTLDWQQYSPWEHLYAKVPSNTHINKYRYFEYLDWFRDVYGKENIKWEMRTIDRTSLLLTDTIYTEICSVEYFSKEELLAESLVIIAQKECA